MCKILIKTGTLIDPKTEQVRKGDVLVENGMISAIGENLSADDAQIIDASGLVVAPGLICTFIYGTRDRRKKRIFLRAVRQQRQAV